MILICTIMDGDNIKMFESILKNNNLRKQQIIYSGKAEGVSSRLCSKENYTPKDVLSNISQQLNALQRADGKVHKNEKKYRLRLINVIKPALEPVNLLPLNNNIPPQLNHKFETQGVSDTQLINVVVNAEKLVTPKGVTQEFENSFYEHHVKKEHKNSTIDSLVISSKKESNIRVNEAQHSLKYPTFEENVPGTSKTCNENEKQESFISSKDNNIGFNNEYFTENSIALSPIINDNKPLQLSKNTSPLIYTLDAFENFETLAFPVVELNPDVEAAKAIINSQIIDRELCLTTHANPTISKYERSVSPILNNRILGNSTSNIATDYNKIYKEPFKEPDKSTSRKVTLSKTEIRKCYDEDIFCSDEEHSEEDNFRELPNTCALETSLSNPSNILDKTMYVGFQTASNKSIQIQTESFSKAQGMLKNLDDCSPNPTLTELVEMCDNTGKYSNEQLNTTHDGTIGKNPVLTDATQPPHSEDKLSIKPLETDASASCAIKELNWPCEQKTLAEKRVHDDGSDGNTLRTINMPTMEEIGLVGFKTASSKKINLTEKALVMCRKVFQDIDLDEIFDSKKLPNTSCRSINIEVNQNKTHYNNDKDKNELLEISDQIALDDQTIIQEFENDLISPHITAPGTKQIENESEDATENQEEKKAFNKHVDYMKDELAPNEAVSSVRNNVMDWNDELCVQHKSLDFSKEIFVGFKTANNKKIKISEHALAKTRNVFEDLNLSNHSDKIYEKVVDKIHTVKDQSTDANNPPNQNIAHETSTSNVSFKKYVKELEPIKACGFITASKKPIIISSEAIIKTKKLFEDIDSSMNGVMEKPQKIGNTANEELKIPDNFPQMICDEDLLKTKHFHGHQTKDRTIETNEFYNAGNGDNKSKSCQIPSNNEVTKSDNVYTNDKMLNNLLLDESNDRVKANHSKAKVNGVLDNNHQIKEINNFNQVFKGFQTASNKQVKISEKSLAASRKIFQDLQLNANEQNENVDNHISNKKQNSISSNIDTQESASPKTKFTNVQLETERLNDFSTDKSNFQDQKFEIAQHHSFVGFRSASNKIINISDQALAKSKNMFLDLDIINDPDELNKTSSKSTAYDVPVTESDDNSLENKDLLPNNNKVKLSHEALFKCKKLSEDSDEENKEVNNYTTKEKGTPKYCNNAKKNKTGELLFKTANNNNIKVSEAALLKTKKVLMDFNQNNQICKGNCGENIINTQLLNNFEDTLYTEDFCEDLPANNAKRSGSPILSCPRAKKPRRFEVPYTKCEIPRIKVPEIKICELNTSNIFAFDKTYKKNTKICLKTVSAIEKLSKCVIEVDPYILTFNFDNILDFEFANKRNEISEIAWSTEDLKRYFLSLVNKKIIPDGWLDNHIKLIIFKLISYEMEYKYAMQGVCTVKNVLEQLKYRYDRELYNVERPALRKLLEKDDVSTKTMVLRVIAIYVDGAAVPRNYSITDTNNVELLLSDGWYCIKASLDQMLTRLIHDRMIRVGTKIVTNGAELLNCEQGIAPWENTSSVRLKLFGNSTRRARWDAKLGYHSGAAILSTLSRVELEGGKVSKLRALVTRVYPTLYVEKFDDGSTVTRSERLEHMHEMKYESDRHALLEKIYEEVEKEFVDEESQDSECDADVKNLETGSQINRLMKRSRDSGEFVANLTSSQCIILQNYTDRRRERLLQTLQDRVKDRIKEQGLQVGRNVVPVLKIRVADVTDDGEVSKAMLSIWRPNEAVMDIIKEGTWIDAFNIVPTAKRYSEIQLSAGRRTVFSRSNYKVNEKVQRIASSLKRTCYSIESLVKNPTAVSDYNEVDIVGLIFLIEPSVAQFESAKGQHFQNVYLTDADKNIICVNFWGGLKKFGYENILDSGLVLACMNLQKRTGNSRKGIPQYRATEYSYFTKTSKHANVRIMMDDLNKRLSSINIKELCESCVAIKNNYSIFKNNVENVSPYRINYSDYNISKHRAFIDSPLARKLDHVDDILNLSGLDFESTFKQIDTQDVSADALLRKKTINEKIAKLKMYGEPPPLKAIHIINKSKNATKDFKSPLASRNDSANGVVSDKLHEKSNSAKICAESTPEISNKHCLKRIRANPVKLNFSTSLRDNDCGENKVDPFAEEFDISPPLSLD